MAEVDETTDGIASLGHYLRVLGNEKRLRLLKFLTTPHYLEEIASELKMARQSAQEHVQQLLDIGVIQRLPQRRGGASVVDYVIVPQRLFAIYDEFGMLGGLEATPEEDELLYRSRTTPLSTNANAPREGDLPRLTTVHGLRIGATVPLSGSGPWLIGREVDAAVSLDYDPFVSGRHAEVRRTEAGFEVADLYSSNGTLHDWHPLGRGGVAALENGNLIRAGKTILLFRAPT